MRRLLWIVTVLLGVAGCAHYPIELQAPAVTGCTLVGVVSETANPDRLSAFVAEKEMIHAVRRRARELGATHIVWLHKTPIAAAAQAYVCQGR